MRRFIVILAAAAAIGATPLTRGESTALENKGLECRTGGPAGLPSALNSRLGAASRKWLKQAIGLRVKNEVTGVVDSPVWNGAAPGSARFEKLGLTLTQRWSRTAAGLAWDLTFEGGGPRAGHEVILDWPALSAALEVFTPGERGVVKVAAHPSFKPVVYAHMGWSTGQAYVLPLASVMDPRSDLALTIALPPDRNIPHLQVEWLDASILRFTLGHRAMGGGKPSPLRILLYTHPADYRSAIKTYSDEFPAYFKPVIPPKFKGAFYYHNIEVHPDFDEMARQHVRYMWSSFWMPYMGELLPLEQEWYPNTYPQFHKTMTDARINTFIAEMLGHGIGTYAYFNTTEFGGRRGQDNSMEAGDRLLKERLADAIVTDASGKTIKSWADCIVMNPGRKYSLRPWLMEQARRHIARLKGFLGFAVDREDWASIYDYNHADGLSMIGDREVENMAEPVADAMQELARITHNAGKSLVANQFYRIELLRDVDAYCNENDWVRGIGYVSPYRSSSAWHMRKPYRGDLLAFEGQLKQRLQFAMFPQMIAHQFPIVQQRANPAAADMLEIYAPLFDTLYGKKQVLAPHCVRATGPNDVNLFVNAKGEYIVPVTSRVRFMSRGNRQVERVVVTLNRPDAADLKWAHVWAAERAPYRASVRARAGSAEIVAEMHGTASMIITGKGADPSLRAPDAEAIAATLNRAFPETRLSPPAASRPDLAGVTALALRLRGVQAGEAGTVRVFMDGNAIGEAGKTGETEFSIPCGAGLIACPGRTAPSPRAPELALKSGDEGTWFVPEKVELVAALGGGRRVTVAQWTIGEPAGGSPDDVRLALGWREIPAVSARR